MQTKMQGFVVVDVLKAMFVMIGLENVMFVSVTFLVLSVRSTF